MPCKEWTKSIKGADDIELDIPRASPLIYHCTAPEGKTAEGLVFVIPDFGEDASGEYQQSLRAYLAEKYGLLAVTVEYHCYRSRPATGAIPIFTPEEYTNLRLQCAKHGILITHPSEVTTALARLPRHYQFDLRLATPNGDYQNFGVMQALDHLLVLADLRATQEIEFDANNIIAFGSSHGAYIAHLIAKFAPNTLRAVIDNSAYTAPPLPGHTDGRLHLGPSCFEIHGLARVDLHLDTQWSIADETAANYYSGWRHAIRHLALPEHIRAAREASQRPCQFRIIHSVRDATQPIDARRQQAQLLQSAGFDVIFKEIDEADIDGRMVKTLQHGMDASLRALFDYFYPTLQPSPGQADAEMGTDVLYLCGDLAYSFGHGQWGCRMHIEDLKTLRAAPAASEAQA